MAARDNPGFSDTVYHHLGSWVARTAARISEKEAVAADDDLRIAAELIPSTGAEFLVRSRVAGLAGGAALSAFFGLTLGWLGIAIGVLFAVWYPGYARRALADRAAARLDLIRARLSFAAELMVAQLTAGASPAASVRSVAAELAGHPAGDELALLARAVEGGQTLASAARRSVALNADADLRQVVIELCAAMIGASPWSRRFERSPGSSAKSDARAGSEARRGGPRKALGPCALDLAGVHPGDRGSVYSARL